MSVLLKIGAIGAIGVLIALPSCVDIEDIEAEPRELAALADPEQVAAPGSPASVAGLQSPVGLAQEVLCAGADCCPPALTQIAGSDDAEDWSSAEAGVCLVLLDGDDKLSVSGARTIVLAGEGDDTIEVDGAAFVAAGGGDDKVTAIGTGTEIDGGAGADVIHTGKGHHIITPGPGADTVIGGGGNIVVQVLDRCELAAGEQLIGGGPEDTLVIPVSLKEAKALGVSIQGFERVNVTGATCSSNCAPAACVPGDAA